MKRIALIAALALAAPAFGQEKAPAQPAPKPEAAPEPAKPKPMARKHGPKYGEDARHCLELPSNTEIIKCAEEYL